MLHIRDMHGNDGTLQQKYIYTFISNTSFFRPPEVPDEWSFSTQEKCMLSVADFLFLSSNSQDEHYVRPVCKACHKS